MKKRIIAAICSFVLIMGMTACGNAGSSNTGSVSQTETPVQSDAPPSADAAMESEPETPVEVPAEQEVSADSKSLVVYFSVPETTEPDNMASEEANSTVVINGEVLGNTQYVAYLIRDNTGSDIFRIEPVTPYPMDHAELEAVATEEARQQALPEISAAIEDIAQYDTIFVGYPNWYADMPRILYSFFEQYDLTGKTIIPFVTSGGSGFSDTISAIEEMEPNATVVQDGLSVLRNNAQDAEPVVIEWLAGLAY